MRPLFATVLKGLAPLSLLVAQFAAAQVTPPGFGGYKHIRWTVDDGAPGTAYKIEQTSDGYLWLAGDGLFRFDGVTFERIEWPAGSPKHAFPSELMVSRRGELWVGLSNKGGVAAYRDGRLVDLRMPDPLVAISSMVQAPDGTVWIASGQFDHQLRRLRAGRWESVGETLGLPEGAITGILAAADGGLWIALTHKEGQSGALAYLPSRASRFREMPYPLAGRAKIALDPQGALWVSDATGTRMLLDGQGKPPVPAIRFPPLPNVRIAWPVFDHDGGIWGTTASVGIFHIPPAAAGRSDVFGFTAANGLSSDFAYKPFVDREGSIWIATESGIDQFRRASVTQELAIPADPVQGLAIAGSRDGSIYIESQRALFRAEPGRAPRSILTLGAGDVMICAARDEGIWVIETSRILRVHGDRASVLPPYPGGEPPTACAEDRLGRLWVALFNGKLLWRDGGGWHARDDQPAANRVWALISTPWGDPAFSTRKAEIGMVRGDRLTVTEFGSADMGMGSMLAAGTHDLFFGRSGGLLRLRDGRWQSLSEIRFPWLADLRSLVQTVQGETWLVSRDHVSRVATADLDRAFDDPRASLPRMMFDAQDGLASATQHPGFTGVQTAAGGDGRAWLLNRQGAAYFDSATLKRNLLAPPVAIRSVLSSGKSWRDPSRIVLPAGAHAIDIVYAGLSLAVPQRIRFRYRLEGVDEGWVEAGARRGASYTNLAPGKYRFHVIAANNDGVWNAAGATLEFEIPPTFLQSWPFKLLCGAGALGLLWAAYAMRVRVLGGRIRLRMAERLAERERIARELHDTLIQGVQGLILRFQLIANDLPDGQAQQEPLEQALDTADAVLGEARDRVLDLRATDRSETLESELAKIAHDGASGPRVGVFVDGMPRAVDSHAKDEVLGIVSEAVANARAHAEAACIEIRVAFGPRRLSVSVVDDGRGIAPELLREGGRPGHFGLAGMRERARAVRGRLSIESNPDAGTAVTLTIAARHAYAPHGWRALFARRMQHDWR